MKKNWYQSRTLWTALCTFLTIAATELFADPAVAEGVREVTAWLLPAVMGALRLLTRAPVGLKN